MEKYNRIPYNETILSIRDKILNAKCTTLQGTRLIDDMYRTLNESDTPLLSLKRFISGGEAIALQDTTVKDVLDFSKKAVITNVDLNFLINLCKEEHLDTLKKSGHPAPKETLKVIEDLFSKPSSAIEQAIKTGLFKDLKSELYMKINAGFAEPQLLSKEAEKKQRKAAIADAAKVQLNESRKTVVGTNFIRYSPVGFMVKAPNESPNKQVALLEGHFFEISKNQPPKGKTVFELFDGKVTLSEAENRVAHALNSQPYNPKTGCFRLSESWDFDMWLNPKGEVKIATNPAGSLKPTVKTVDKSHVQKLLFESIDHYLATNKIKDAQKHLVDADNFMALMENNNKLICFDNLYVFKNLNENIGHPQDFVIVPTVQDATLKMYHNNEVKMFESYGALKNAIDTIMGDPIINLFESEIQREQLSFTNKLVTKQKLTEKMSSLNEAITRVDKLMSIAENDSPAMNELKGQKQILTNTLQKVLKELNRL